MAERLVKHTTRYGKNPYPIPLMLGVQDGAGPTRYWSTEETVKDRSEALTVARRLLPNSCEVIAAEPKPTGRYDPSQVWLVTVGPSEGSDAAELVEIFDAYFTEYKP